MGLCTNGKPKGSIGGGLAWNAAVDCVEKSSKKHHKIRKTREVKQPTAQKKCHTRGRKEPSMIKICCGHPVVQKPASVDQTKKDQPAEAKEPQLSTKILPQKNQRLSVNQKNLPKLYNARSSHALARQEGKRRRPSPDRHP